MNQIIGTIGLPGSGKSTFGNIATEYDSSIDVVSLGDVVRDLCDTDNVGRFANGMRQEYGNGVFVRRLLQQYTFNGNNTVIVDGIRSPEEIEALQNQTDHPCKIIYISAPQEIRAERISGREDRSEDDIQVRDERELNWGLQSILATEQYDVEIANTGSFSEFKSEVEHLLESSIQE